MMALPPIIVGGVKLTVALALPVVAVTVVGGSETVAETSGVTLADGLDAGPVPTAFVAVTVNV